MKKKLKTFAKNSIFFVNPPIPYTLTINYLSQTMGGTQEIKTHFFIFGADQVFRYWWNSWTRTTTITQWAILCCCINCKLQILNLGSFERYIIYFLIILHMIIGKVLVKYSSPVLNGVLHLTRLQHPTSGQRTLAPKRNWLSFLEFLDRNILKKIKGLRSKNPKA